jgi:hypothetical protein
MTFIFKFIMFSDNSQIKTNPHIIVQKLSKKEIKVDTLFVIIFVSIH